MSTFLASPAMQNLLANNVRNSKTFCSSVISLVSNNPLIAECEKSSVVSACMLGDSLNLSCSSTLGYFYCVPFQDKKSGMKKAQFILGYKGFVQLAIRSGNYKKLNVLPIKAGELKRWDPLNEELEILLIEDEAEREQAETIGYYASFEYLNGFRKAIYWSKSKMIAHADRYSKAFNYATYQKIQAGQISESEMWKYSSFWYKDFDAMACKTMIRQLISKWGITSAEMVKAMESDEKTIQANSDGTTEAIDVVPEAPEGKPEALPAPEAKAVLPESKVEDNSPDVYEGEIPPEEEDPFLS
jgi:recombination protein RecT